MKTALALAALAVTAVSASAQVAACDVETETLLDSVRAAVVRYADADAAELDGFRAISHDFPGMGEHWINLRHAALDRFDPSRPPILLYARRDGRPVLVGAAFVTLRDAGETAPGPAALRSAWHEHSGTLDQELFAADHHAGHDDGGFAVLVLHVWSTPPLGGGWFDVQNWRLPWLRAGIDARSADVDAARAVSLTTSRAFYRHALLRGGIPLEDADELDVILDARAARAAALLASTSGLDEAALAAVWLGFVDRLRSRWPDAHASIESLLADPRVDVTCAS